MYVCKVIGKVISTVKNEKLIGHSIVLVRTASARTLPLTWRWWAFWTEGSTASAEGPVSDQDMR